MLRIKIIQKGKPLKVHLWEVKQLQDISKAKLLTIGLKTKNEMIKIIDQNSKESASPKGIRNSIKLYPFANGGFGIGLISELPEHWKAQNWGHTGYVINAKNVQYLKFKDKSGRIIYRKVVHNHPIRPINFLEKSIVFLLSHLAAFKIGKK